MMCDECGIRPAKFHLTKKTIFPGRKRSKGIFVRYAWQSIKNSFQGWISPILRA